MSNIRFALTVLFFAACAVAVALSLVQYAQFADQRRADCRKAGGTPITVNGEFICLAPGMVLPLERQR